MDILKYLMENQAQNAPIIDLLKRDYETVISKPEGVVLYDTYSETYFVSVTDNSLLTQNVFTKGRKAILALRCLNIETCSLVSGFTKIEHCHQMVCFSKNSVYVPSKTIEIRQLDLTALDIVCRHYSLGLGAKYVTNRIETGNLFGAFIGKELAGFVGRHDEGAVGMLEVLPEFRKRGVGTELLQFIAARVIKLGFTPYGHIFHGNAASLALMAKLDGVQITNEEVGWIFGK